MLEVALRAKFIHTTAETMDADRHGFYKPWRNAVYCEGDKECVKQVLMFMDGFVHWCTFSGEGEDEFAEIPKLNIEMPVSFNIEFEEQPEKNEDKEMDLEFAVKYTETPKAKVTDCPPP